MGTTDHLRPCFLFSPIQSAGLPFGKVTSCLNLYKIAQTVWNIDLEEKHFPNCFWSRQRNVSFPTKRLGLYSFPIAIWWSHYKYNIVFLLVVINVWYDISVQIYFLLFVLTAKQRLNTDRCRLVQFGKAVCCCKLFSGLLEMTHACFKSSCFNPSCVALAFV